MSNLRSYCKSLIFCFLSIASERGIPFSTSCPVQDENKTTINETIETIVFFISNPKNLREGTKNIFRYILRTRQTGNLVSQASIRSISTSNILNPKRTKISGWHSRGLQGIPLCFVPTECRDKAQDTPLQCTQWQGSALCPFRVAWRLLANLRIYSQWASGYGSRTA